MRTTSKSALYVLFAVALVVLSGCGLFQLPGEPFGATATALPTASPTGFAVVLPTATLPLPTQTPRVIEATVEVTVPVERTVVRTQVVTKEVAVTVTPSPSATPTTVRMTPSPQIPGSFLPGGAWDSDTLTKWTKSNLGTLLYLLGVMGIEDSDELTFVEVRRGDLPEAVPMFAVRADGTVYQGNWLAAGKEVWYLVFSRNGEEVAIPVNPDCANLVGVVKTPGATAVFTPLPSLTPTVTSTPGGPTSTPWPTNTPGGPTETPPPPPTRTPWVPTNTPRPSSTPGPSVTPTPRKTNTPRPTITPQGTPGEATYTPAPTQLPVPTATRIPNTPTKMPTPKPTATSPSNPTPRPTATP